MSPQIPPAPTDWYIVIPLPRETDPGGYYGSAQSFVANVSDMDDAAQVAHEHGFPRCVVVLGTHYFDPTVVEPPVLP